MASKSNVLEALHEQVAWLEVVVSGCNAGSLLFARVVKDTEELGVQHGLIESQAKYVEERIDFLTTMIKWPIEEFQGHLRSLEDEIVLLKHVMLQGMPSISKLAPTNVRLLESKPFGGAQNAKDLENFLWDMEQYFNAACILANEQVMITSMYLFEDAKLWWRTRTSDDVANGRPRINTQEMLKKELKDQF